MAEADPRATLERLIRERKDDYSALSRMIGRNPAYVQQYIKRGSPKRLPEAERRQLASYFGVAEEMLGGSAGSAGDYAPVPRLDVGASAGMGASVGEERALPPIAFDPKWLRGLGIRDASLLSIIRVAGDSMMPALSDGDEILVDRGDAADRLRDGIYVLRLDDNLMVKRLAVNPAARLVQVRSDNPAYPSWPDCPASAIALVGRVVWVGRRLV
jgi:phage repressor protein C with HTH and peptisase S24 domain